MTLVFLALWSACAGSAEAGRMRDRSPVRVHAPPAVLMVRGAENTVTVRLRIDEGFHIRADPAADPFLVPLTLHFKPSPDVECRVLDYGEALVDDPPGTGEGLRVHAGSASVRVLVRASPDALPGRHPVAGLLRYQACGARLCLAPAVVPIRFSVWVIEEP